MGGIDFLIHKSARMWRYLVCLEAGGDHGRRWKPHQGVSFRLTVDWISSEIIRFQLINFRIGRFVFQLTNQNQLETETQLGIPSLFC